RAAASRTFCTAGSNRPMRIAIIAITTSNSMSVKPDRREKTRKRNIVTSEINEKSRQKDDLPLFRAFSVRAGHREDFLRSHVVVYKNSSLFSYINPSYARPHLWSTTKNHARMLVFAYLRPNPSSVCVSPE